MFIKWVLVKKVCFLTIFPRLMGCESSSVSVLLVPIQQHINSETKFYETLCLFFLELTNFPKRRSSLFIS
jgi:hypothetical protein